MRKFYFVLTAVTLLSLSAWAQTDVTAKYLKNADFASGTPTAVDVLGYGKDLANEVAGSVYGMQSITGWESTVLQADNTNASYPNSGLAGAVFAYGSTPQLKGNKVTAPATGPDGTATGNALGFFAVWSSSGYYYQDVTLPAGNYKITYQFYSQSGDQVPSESFFGFIPDDGGVNRVLAPSELMTVGQWLTKSVKFTLAKETKGKIAIGYASSGQGAAKNPHLFVDHVAIEYNNIGEDITEKIVNPSFEADGKVTDTPQGWTVVGGGDKGAKENSNDTYKTAGCDGDYVFNIWGGSAPRKVSQTITLDAGRYMLSALLAADATNLVTLFAGDQHLNTVIGKGKGEFTEYDVFFDVAANGTQVEIGALTNTAWFKADDFHLFKLNDDVEGVEDYAYNAADWKVSGSTVTLNTEKHYSIPQDARYIVAQVGGVGTAIGDTKLTTLNGVAEGHYPTYTWTIGGDTYFVWDIEASRFSLWYTLGDNLSIGTAKTQLNSKDGVNSTVFTFNGTPSVSSIYFTDAISGDLATAKAYAELTNLIEAAKELNTKLDDEPTIASGITAAESVAANASQTEGTYTTARGNLLKAIRDGLPNAGAEVDVTDIYIVNNSFETGWAVPWVPNAAIAGGENTVKGNAMWGKDGNYVYNQWGGGDIAGSLTQNLSDLAAGDYTLEAAVVGAENKVITVKLGDNTDTYTTPSNNNQEGHVVTVTGTYGDNASVQIGVTTQDTWFKSDNFRLTYKPQTSVVDKTELRRMILTAENLIKLGEGNDDFNLDYYTRIANSTTANDAEVAAAVTGLRELIQSSYDTYNKDSRPVASAPAAGEFFLYNVATKSYLNVGSEWGTRAIANDYRGEAGLLLTLAVKNDAKGDPGFSMNTKYVWNDDVHFLFAGDRNGVYIDGNASRTTELGGVSKVNTWAEMSWKFEEVPGLEDRNVYRLYRTSGDERVYGMTPGSRIKRVMALDNTVTEGKDLIISTLDADGVLNDLNSYWILVSKEQRIADLAGATINAPKNASFVIRNPDMEGENDGGADFPQMLPRTWTWEYEGGGAETGQRGNANATDFIGDRSFQSYNSDNFNFNQTITLPKAGLYKLRVNGFYRPGNTDAFDPAGAGGFKPASNFAAILQHKGEVTMNAYLYAGEQQQVPLMSINTGDQGTILPFGIATDDKNGSSTFKTNAKFWDQYGNRFFDYGHVPDQVAAGTDRFREDNGEGRYSDNALLVYAPSDNYELKIGVKKEAKMDADWTLFDHFNLWYMGSEGSDALVKAYNDYRAARIDAINLLFDTYHYTLLRDTVYTRYLDANGFGLADNEKYGGSPTDVWNAGDPYGTTVFARWIKDELKNSDQLLSNAMSTAGDVATKATQIQSAADALNYNVATAKLGYQMAEFYFFSRGVQQFYATAKDGSSQMMGSGSKENLMSTNKVDDDIATLQNIELRVLNTLKKAMGVSGYNESLVMNLEGVKTLTDSLTTNYADPSTLAMNNVVPSTNKYKDQFLPHAIDVARNLTPPTRSEFDLTFMLPRADVIGLEQWDWMPVFEWLSDDNPEKSPYNYDIHSNNNTYKGHNAYFAERWRSKAEGIDENTWAIYQNLQLPRGLYRFSAAAFARNGGEEESSDKASNAYVAINLKNAAAEKVMEEAVLIPTIKLDDISSFYEITNNVLTDGLADVNVGMYVGTKSGDIASWIGMSQMRLYKIPETTISEDKVYRCGMDADGHNDGYSNDPTKTGDEYNYYPESENGSHAEEVANYPYLFNISPAARITGVKRTFKKGVWQTLTFPFDMSRQEFLDMVGITDVVINQFTGSRVRHYEDWSEGHPEDKLGARVDLYFERETGDAQDSIHAHVPCLVYIPENAGFAVPSWEPGTWYNPGSVEVVKAKEASAWPDKESFDPYNGTDGVYMAEFSFDACYAGVNVGEKYDAEGNSTAANDGLGFYLPETSYYISGNEFKYVPRKDDWDKLFPSKAGKYNPVRSKGLRGYFTYHGASQQVKAGNIAAWTYEFETDNGTDKIELNNFGEVVGREINGRDVTGVYNMNGQMIRKDGSSLEGLSKGVYIVNGNKVIIK